MNTQQLFKENLMNYTLNNWRVIEYMIKKRWGIAICKNVVYLVQSGLVKEV